MEFQDYYKILGIAKGASQEEIQRAYRKLARKMHPDVNKNKGAEEEFKKINEANAVLKDPEKRKLYDAYGENWKEGGQQQQRQSRQYSGRPGAQGFSRSFHFNDNEAFEETTGFSDFFNDLFGGRSAGRHQNHDHFDMPGRSHEAEISVSLADVCHGATRSISFQTYEVEQGGQIKPVNKTLQVKIPKGITNGAVIRLAGQGEKGSGQGAAGDMLLRINILPDPRFRIQGHDLYTIVAVSPWEAALGVKIPVQTVNGIVTLTVPKGSQNGSKLRLRGKGIPKRKGAPGDIIVELEMRMPDQLSQDEERLMEEMARKSRYNPREKSAQRAGDHEYA